jgi:hypothetical protein
MGRPKAEAWVCQPDLPVSSDLVEFIGESIADATKADDFSQLRGIRCIRGADHPSYSPLIHLSFIITLHNVSARPPRSVARVRPLYLRDLASGAARPHPVLARG